MKDMMLSEKVTETILDELAYAYVRGWYDGLDGIRTDSNKIAVAKEQFEKFLPALREAQAEAYERAAKAMCAFCEAGYPVEKEITAKTGMEYFHMPEDDNTGKPVRRRCIVGVIHHLKREVKP